MIRFPNPFRRPAEPAWTPEQERELSEAKTHHERSSGLARAKYDARHAQLAAEVWGQRKGGWRSGWAA